MCSNQTLCIRHKEFRAIQRVSHTFGLETLASQLYVMEVLRTVLIMHRLALHDVLARCRLDNDLLCLVCC